MASILDELADDAEHLGASLCSDPQITANHMVKLQSIDLLAQTLRQLSEVLAADTPISAADNIRLDDLRSRLLAMTHAQIDHAQVDHTQTDHSNIDRSKPGKAA